MTRLRTKHKKLELETLKDKKRQKLPREELKLLRNLKSRLAKKKAETKIPKPQKKPQEASSKTKSTEKKINSDPKAPQIVTKSSNQLKRLLEKLMKIFSLQDGECFSSQKTDDVFVSGKLRTKYWNQKERRVCPEHRMMEYHYFCIWNF